MPSSDDRQSSALEMRPANGAQSRLRWASGRTKSSVTDGLQMPGLVSQLSPVEQLPFPESTSFPTRTTRRLQFEPSPGTTGALQKSTSSTGVTGPLTDAQMQAQTGTLQSPFSRSTTTALRQPVVIRGSGKKSMGITRPPKGRRWVISASVACLMLFISLGTAMAVAPVGGESGHSFNPFQFVGNLIRSNNSNPNFIAQQAAATATAVTRQDGYDPSGQNKGGGNGGSPPPPQGGGGPNRFAFGQCTYWANMRYHQLTGWWVPWLGNAYQWAYQASAYGWVVSSTPKVPSIIVLAPGVQGASGYGHVAIVESINKDGSVHTSNYNWYDGGGWDRLSYFDFRPGPGVVFVWHA